MRKFLFAIAAIVLLVVIVKPSQKEDNENSGNGNQTKTVEEKLPEEVMGVTMDKSSIEEIKEGTGNEALRGKLVTVHYEGSFESGEVFDSSIERGVPFTFNLGEGEVIQGWDLGVTGMKVGGKRKLTIPPELAYGDRGVPGAIPPNSTLIFEVELLKVE